MYRLALRVCSTNHSVTYEHMNDVSILSQRRVGDRQADKYRKNDAFLLVK